MSDNLTVRYTPLADLLLWDRNPKRHDLGAIAESMTRYGFKDPPKYEPLLNNGRGGIVEGNGRIEALQWMRQQGQHAPRGIVSDDSGGWLVPVLYGVDAASEASAAAYGVDHNNLVLSGGDFTAVDAARLWDSQTYAALVSELAADDEVPESIGDDAVSALIAALQDDDEDAGAGGDEFDATPEEGGPTRVQRGDLWEIVGQGGRVHRLLCGDSTSADDVARLMAGQRAQGVFTSPPYAEQRKQQYGGVPSRLYVDWFEQVQAAIRLHLAADGSFFINIKPHCTDGERDLYVFDLVLAMRRLWGWRYIDELCWTGNAFPGLRGPRFKNGFEPVYHFGLVTGVKFRPGNVVLDKDPGESVVYDETGGGVTLATVKGGRSNGARVRSKHFDGALPSNVIRAYQGAGSPDHVAVFPVGLPDFFVRAYSDEWDVWLDPFLGSGTSIIAAERTGRVCYGLEISERYCDVILKRAEAEGMTCRKIDTGGM